MGTLLYQIAERFGTIFLKNPDLGNTPFRSDPILPSTHPNLCQYLATSSSLKEPVQYDLLLMVLLSVRSVL